MNQNPLQCAFYALKYSHLIFRVDVGDILLMFTPQMLILIAYMSKLTPLWSTCKTYIKLTSVSINRFNFNSSIFMVG